MIFLQQPHVSNPDRVFFSKETHASNVIRVQSEFAPRRCRFCILAIIDANAVIFTTTFERFSENLQIQRVKRCGEDFARGCNIFGDFFGVGGSGRRPFESADPEWGPACGALGELGPKVTVLLGVVVFRGLGEGGSGPK